MKKWIVFFWILFSANYSFATAILAITPSSTTAITISLDGTSSLSYTVTNNSSKTVNNLNITPDFGVTALLTASVASNACTGSLTSGASCTFTDSITGKGVEGTTRLMPRVCAFNGLVCSVPVLANRVSVSVITRTLQSIAITPTTPTTLRRLATVQFTATGTYSDSTTQDITTSVTWNSSNTSAATIGANTGAMSGVGAGTTNITASSGSVTSNTIALTFQDFAYITNFGNNTVSYCSINASDGTLATCTAVTNAGAGNSTFNGPYEISINPAHTRLYISNNNNNTVSNCPLNANGSLGTCSAISDATFNFPTGNAVHPNGNFAYIANGNTNMGISICPINSSGGFNTCTRSTILSDFRGVDISPSGLYAYLNDATNSKLNSCDVNTSTGGLSNCNSNSSFTFTDPLGVAVHPNGNFVYMTNNSVSASTTPITRCNINTSTGVLTACALQSITLASGGGGYYMTFHPSDSTKLYIAATDAASYNRVILATVNATTGDISSAQLLSDSTFDIILGIAID